MPGDGSSGSGVTLKAAARDALEQPGLFEQAEICAEGRVARQALGGAFGVDGAVLQRDPGVLLVLEVEFEEEASGVRVVR